MSIKAETKNNMTAQYQQGAGAGGRIRFHKPKQPMETAREDPYGCISHVFIWLYLEDFRNELHEWLRVALINEQGSYGDGYAREDLMDFCSELQNLAEAMDRINKSRKPEDLHRWMDDFQYGLQEVTKSPDRLEPPKGEQNPIQMVGRFCDMFTLSYARRELWDLLDSLKFYEKESNDWGPDPLTTYQCLLALAEAAFALEQISL
jgi:hypothetical protein